MENSVLLEAPDSRIFGRESREVHSAIGVHSNRLYIYVFSSGGHFGARRIKRVMVDPSARGGKSESRPLPVGEQATTLSISRNGRLVYAREIRDSNIWKLDVPASAVTRAKPVRLISSTLDDQSPTTHRTARRSPSLRRALERKKSGLLTPTAQT